jgi:prophage DNA circulation protein
MSDFVKSLRQASFRGVPFAVLTSEGQYGRRLAIHEYPFRDKPWLEDLGRKTRPITFTAFLVSDSLVYGGGDVQAQREKLVAACEAPGSGKLVHPTLGDLTVAADGVVITERWNEHRYFEVAFRFIEDGGRIYPATTAATGPKVAAKGLEGMLEAAEAWSAKATAALAKGSIAVQKALATARGWTDRITGLGQDAAGMFRLTGALSGSFGRYFLGRLRGGFTAVTAFRQPLTSVTDLIVDSAAGRALLALRGDAVLAALGALGQGGSLEDVAAAVAAQVEALADSLAGPADRVRLLIDLTAYAPSLDLLSSAVGGALGDLYRRAAVIALANAATTYQPASFDDASEVLARVLTVLDAEILIAGDAGEDGVFSALRALRAAVVEDLRARGANLAPIADFATPEPMPSLTLAQRLYRDPSRAAELEIQADPIHPLFMPTAFRALAR